MKWPGFFEGVAVAVIAAISAEILSGLLPWLIGQWSATLSITSLLSLTYLLYLLSRAPTKTGRVTLLLIWSVCSFSAVALDLGITFFLMWQLAFIWLTRCFYFHTGLFGALADLALHGLAASAAVWAYSRSGSVFLSVWSFFLVEALFPLLPSSQSIITDASESSNNLRFEQAHRTALSALERLSTR